MNIKCNKCGALFRAGKIRIRSRSLTKDIEQSFYNCPGCGEEYTILITDPETRELIKAGKRDEARQRSLMLRVKYLDYGLRR